MTSPPPPPALLSIDAYYVLYLAALMSAVTSELVTLQWLHLFTPTLLPLALVLQAAPDVVGYGEIARLFTFSRHGFTAQTTRRAFFTGLLRFGALFFTYLALTSTNGAMSQPVFAVQFHAFIHALRLLITRKRSLVRWNGAVLIIAGVACVTMTQTNPDFALARPAMTVSALAIYAVYLQLKLCVVPIACLLGAQLCEIGIGDEDLDVRALDRNDWHVTGTLALAGFTLYAVVLPLLSSPATTIVAANASCNYVCLALALPMAYFRRAMQAHFMKRACASPDLESVSIVNLVRAFAIITTLFALPSGLSGLRSCVLAGVSNIFTMAGAMAIEADRSLEARSLAAAAAAAATTTVAAVTTKKRK